MNLAGMPFDIIGDIHGQADALQRPCGAYASNRRVVGQRPIELMETTMTVFCPY